MKLKQGVSMKGLQPEIMLGLIIVEHTYRRFNTELVITKGTEGKHKLGSKHKEGLAADTRIRDFMKTDIPKVVKSIQDDLSDEYDVVLESDHIHLEFDPKSV